jgi:aspartate aminotransferase-like enzyme
VGKQSCIRQGGKADIAVTTYGQFSARWKEVIIKISLNVHIIQACTEVPVTDKIIIAVGDVSAKKVDISFASWSNDVGCLITQSGPLSVLGMIRD